MEVEVSFQPSRYRKTKAVIQSVLSPPTSLPLINVCGQKQLFDSLCSMSKDTSLLLKTVENTHLNTCNSVKAEVNKIIVFLKFISRFQKSKHYHHGSIQSYFTKLQYGTQWNTM